LNNDYNQDLSERRARAVADAVRAGGAPASRISVQGAGSGKRSANPSREAMQRSRRVDIQIR
jgi:OOP family OmpA-OmpF porin